MNIRILKTLLIALLAGLAAPSYAHAPEPARCSAPARPHDDQNDVLWQQFLDDIEQFRACVQNRMQAEEQAASAHQAAARAAVEDWNTFVRTSLNAPEDFPWPES